MLSRFKQQIQTVEDLKLDSIAWKVDFHREYIEVYCDAQESVMHSLSNFEDLQLTVNSTGRWLKGDLIHQNTLIKFVVYLQF